MNENDEDTGGPVQDPGEVPQGPAVVRLTELLRAAMAECRMNPANLAEAAGLSKGGVSNILKGKSVPTTHTLDLLGHALQLKGPRLAELHRLRDRASVRTRRLDTYLAAAHRAAQQQQYPGLTDGVLPPLASIHVRQQIEQEAAAAVGDTPVAADGLEVLAQGRTCVVLAGPGGGKSSLLQAHMCADLERWKSGRGSGAVPVYVPAAALAAAPLSQALAAAVTAELATSGLTEDLPAAFFATPPAPGVRWYVLVDGLDEVTDAATRTRILQGLAAVADSDAADLYRFVVASRPVPDHELGMLGSAVPRYFLQPFAAEVLPAVALQWFTTLGVYEPQAVTDRFVAYLGSSRLEKIAHIPLVLGMLCQLHALRPECPLPVSRGAVYREFTEALFQRLHARGESGIHVQTRLALGRFGEQTVARAARLVDQLPELIDRAADCYVDDQRLSLLDLILTDPAAASPDRSLAREWRSFLLHSAARTGLVVSHGEDLRFVHQTVLEYCAARHATRSPVKRGERLREMFQMHADSQKKTSARWQSGSLYRSFLLDDGLPLETATVALIEHTITDEYLLPVSLIAAEVASGTGLPKRIVELTARKLEGVTRACHQAMGDRRFTRAVAKLGPAFSGRQLLDWGDQSLSAARALAAFEPALAADLLDELTRLRDDPPFREKNRLKAAETLLDLHQARGLDAMARLAADPFLFPSYRVAAVEWMRMHGDERALEISLDLARTLYQGPDQERAETLARTLQLDARIAGLVRRIAEKSGEPDPDDREMLAIIAAEDVMQPQVRIMAATVLDRCSAEAPGFLMSRAMAKSRDGFIREW
ncbi:hypothetical protein ACFVFS_22455 [Kitasatospora sp. NPDC057692]|uniref:hypothetical protein n=1 Tax=Kitasatospora sp. NPDC057692 TaxID=3346215 RepID=UPI00368A94D9